VPRAGLSRDLVVAEAATVADEIGYERLTLAAVAERFGVAVPSLYKHVAGLGALRRELALLAVRDLGAHLEQAVQAGGSDLRSVAHAYREFARSHPGRYAATLRAADPSDDEAVAASDAVLATVLTVLGAYGLAGDDAIDAARTLRSSLHGFVTLEHLGGFGLPRDVDRSFERMVEMLDAAFRSWGRSWGPAGSARYRRRSGATA
jgi:AcrR family transcriptional regulator